MGSLTSYINFRNTLQGNMRAFILLAVLALAYGERIKGTFEIPDYAAFKAKWNKSYTADENDVHIAAYLKNVEFINNHNAEYDQGQCGSCWAFSAVCALEGQWAIHQGSLPDCAEQQLVSCDPSSHGCSGPRSVGASEGALQEAVGNVGPISICLCASSSAFGQYSGGIFDDPSCGTSINHAVACVGYDTNQNYWIVRNSWGTSWGESGYIRMVKGKNMCGMLSNSCYPSL